MTIPDDDQYMQSGILEQLTQLTRVHLTCSSCVPKATCDIDICVCMLPSDTCIMLPDSASFTRNRRNTHEHYFVTTTSCLLHTTATNATGAAYTGQTT
jgi:hypothetical protein